MVIAIIAMAIIVYIFYTQTTKSSEQGTGLAACEARNGYCKVKPAGSEGSPCNKGDLDIGNYTCGPGRVCCIRTGFSS